jgi:hypothetical protein
MTVDWSANCVPSFLVANKQWSLMDPSVHILDFSQWTKSTLSTRQHLCVTCQQPWLERNFAESIATSPQHS